MSDLPSLVSDADYRAMLVGAVQEMLRDIDSGDLWRARSIGTMAVILERHGPQSDAAAEHRRAAAFEAANCVGPA